MRFNIFKIQHQKYPSVSLSALGTWETASYRDRCVEEKDRNSTFSPFVCLNVLQDDRTGLDWVIYRLHKSRSSNFGALSWVWWGRERCGHLFPAYQRCLKWPLIANNKLTTRRRRAVNTGDVTLTLLNSKPAIFFIVYRMGPIWMGICNTLVSLVVFFTMTSPVRFRFWKPFTLAFSRLEFLLNLPLNFLFVLSLAFFWLELCKTEKKTKTIV